MHQSLWMARLSLVRPSAATNSHVAIANHATSPSGPALPTPRSRPPDPAAVHRVPSQEDTAVMAVVARREVHGSAPRTASVRDTGNRRCWPSDSSISGFLRHVLENTVRPSGVFSSMPCSAGDRV